MIAENTPVRLKHNPDDVGLTTGKVRGAGEGRTEIEVRFAKRGRLWCPESQIESIADSPSVEEDIKNGRFTGPDALRRSLIHIRLSGKLEDLIYSLEATDTEFHAYQFKPVVKIINSPSNGLLIADEVGLGKTIEAGLIWTELVARLDAKNLLVVCPKSLVDKWQNELRSKFFVRAEIFGPQQLLDLLDDRSRQNHGNAIICSRDSLRPDRGWDDEDADYEGNSNRIIQRDLAKRLQELEGGSPIFDLSLLIDIQQ